MKKNLIALGAALLCAAGAHAQSSVQLTGLVDVFAGSMKMAGDASSKSVVDSGGLTTSWFGMKGTEDLGGGLKAHFNLTSFIKVDTGTQGRQRHLLLARCQRQPVGRFWFGAAGPLDGAQLPAFGGGQPAG